MFSMISSIVSKVMPNIGMIGKAISGAMKAASSVMGGLSSITNSFSKLFGKMGNFMKMLMNPMSMLSKPGQCRRPRPNDFQGSKAAEGAEGKKSEGTGRKPGESIEDFLIRIMNKILENTEKKLEETAKKADKETSSGGKDGPPWIGANPFVTVYCGVLRR